MQETENRLLIRYLLGDLDEAERDRVEESYQADDDFYLKLRVVEDELIDSYTVGELSGRDLEKFKRAYLTNPSRLKRVEANKELLDLIDRRAQAPAAGLRGLVGSLFRALPGRGVSLQYSLAGLLLIGVLCGLLGWLLIDRVRMRAGFEQALSALRQRKDEYQRQPAAAERQPPAEQPPNAPPEDARPGTTGENSEGDRVEQAQPGPGRDTPKKDGERGRVTSPVVAFALPPGGVRAPDSGAGPHGTLLIPRGALRVQLTVPLERNKYEGYRVSIRKVGGPVIWDQVARKGRQVRSGELATFDLPASALPSGDYILKVTGSGPPGEDEILALHQLRARNRNPTQSRPAASREGTNRE